MMTRAIEHCDDRAMEHCDDKNSGACYHQLEDFGKGQKERGDTSPCILPTSQNPSCWNPSRLSNVYTTRKDPESEGLAKDFPGGSVAKTPHSQCRRRGFNPWSGN